MLDRYRNDLALGFTVLVWGTNFVVLKATLAVMHPHVVNVFRFTVSALVIGVLYAYQQRTRRSSFWRPLREHPGALLGLGLLGYVLYQLCFILGIDRTTAGNAALIMASSPLWTAVLGRLFGIEQLRSKAWLGLLGMFMGVLCIVFYGSAEVGLASSQMMGNVLMLLAAAFWGTYTILSKPVTRHVTPTSIVFFGLLVALPILYAVGIPYFPDVEWAGVTVWVVAALVFSGGLSTGLALAIWNTAIRDVGPSQTSAYSNVVPIVALASGVVFLDEPLSFGQIAGGALILGGLMIVRRMRDKVPVASPPSPVQSGESPTDSRVYDR